METNTDIEILNTIYDEVHEELPGVFILKSGDKFGFVVKDSDIFEEAIYTSIIVRENYIHAYGNDQGTVTFLASGIKLSVGEETKGKGIIEHKQFNNYGVIEVREGDSKHSLYNSETGNFICGYNTKLKTTSIRFQNNDIIVAFKDGDIQMGVTKDFRVGEIKELLESIYDRVVKTGVSFKCTKGKETVKLNKFGQLY